MAKKQKNQDVPPQETLQTQQITEETIELVKAALRLVISSKRTHTVMTTTNAIIHSVALLLPPPHKNREVIENVIKNEMKNFKFTIPVGDGIEVVVLYSSIEELVEAVKQGLIDPSATVLDTNISQVLRNSNS
jgi:hypothetical protein